MQPPRQEIGCRTAATLKLQRWTRTMYFLGAFHLCTCLFYSHPVCSHSTSRSLPLAPCLASLDGKAIFSEAPSKGKDFCGFLHVITYSFCFKYLLSTYVSDNSQLSSLTPALFLLNEEYSCKEPDDSVCMTAATDTNNCITLSHAINHPLCFYQK